MQQLKSISAALHMQLGYCMHEYIIVAVVVNVVPALKPGRVIRVTFSPGHPGLTRFTNYPGLTRIGSREKRNCSFDDVETYKRYSVALS